MIPIPSFEASAEGRERCREAPRPPLYVNLKRRDQSLNIQPWDLWTRPRPALGANASPEVTHRFCRLPLVTLLHWPEAIHLGVRMRLSVRPAYQGEFMTNSSTHRNETTTWIMIPLRNALSSVIRKDLWWGFHKNSQGT